MTASIAPNRARLGPLVLLTFALATASPAAAVIIDSFTDPLPANPLLTESARPVLFLGRACDGDACPPASVVEHTAYANSAEQFGLAGVLGGQRWTSVESLLESWGGAPYVHEECLLRVDPAAGGSLIHGPYAFHADMGVAWGDQSTGGLNLDLVADGGDRFQIDLSAPRPPNGELYFLGGLDASGNATHSAGIPFQMVSSAGTLSIPYAEIGGLAAFLHDVDLIALRIHGQVPTAVPVNGGVIALLEVRTNGGAVPATAQTWGRIKSTYRR